MRARALSLRVCARFYSELVSLPFSSKPVEWSRRQGLRLQHHRPETDRQAKVNLYLATRAHTLALTSAPVVCAHFVPTCGGTIQEASDERERDNRKSRARPPAFLRPLPRCSRAISQTFLS